MKKFFTFILNIILNKVISRILEYMRYTINIKEDKKKLSNEIRTVKEITDEIYGLEFEYEQIKDDKSQLQRKIEIVEQIEKLENDLRETTRNLGLN